jgi:hypothetical protein
MSRAYFGSFNSEEGGRPEEEVGAVKGDFFERVVLALLLVWGAPADMFAGPEELTVIMINC